MWPQMVKSIMWSEWTEFSPFNSLRVLRWSDRIEKLINGEICDPVTLSFDFSNRCNHKCGFCAWTKYRKEFPTDLNPEPFYKTVNDMEEMDIRGVEVCGGGEPLVNPHAAEYLSHLHNSYETLLVTNGSLLTESIAASCDTIRVSLDAATPETHRRIHGTNDFAKILRNIKNAVGITRVGIACLIHPDNVHELEEVAKLGTELGVDYVLFRPVYTDYDMVRDSVGFDTYGFLDQNEPAITDQLERAKQHGGKTKIYVSFHKLMPFKGNRGFSKCYALTLNPLISPTGDVWLCCERRGQGLVLGNIKDGLRDLWYSERHKSMVQGLPDTSCPAKCKYAGYNRVIEEVFVKDSMGVNLI